MSNYTIDEIWEIAMEYKESGKQDKIKWMLLLKKNKELKRKIKELINEKKN